MQSQGRGFKAALLATLYVAIGALLVALALYFFAGAALRAFGSDAGEPGFASLRRFMLDHGMSVAATFIFIATYVVMAIGKLPFYRLDRAGAALLGGSLMVGIGVIPLEAAYRAIDFDTITLLLGMMIVVANLRLSGVFRMVGNWVVARARRPAMLLAAIAFVAGALSAFLVNDAICLVLTPLVLDLVRRLKRNPTPYLLAIPMASNAGSVATITGNPQNMIIGSLSQIPYGTFAAALWPTAAVGVALTAALIALAYPREFLTRETFDPIAPKPPRPHRFLAIKSVIVTLAMMALFFLGQPVAKVAIVGGALLLFTRSVKADKVYREIDWPLLLMFVGLFIVVTGFETAVLTPEIIAEVGRRSLETTATLSLATAALSNLVSVVPAVLVLKPFLASSIDPQHSWLVVAMASTLAGNLTLVGSVANLIVAQRAAAENIPIGFWTYFRVGAPLTLLSIAFGVWSLG